MKALAGDRFTKRVVFTKKQMGAHTQEALAHASLEQLTMKEDELCHARSAQRSRRTAKSSPFIYTIQLLAIRVHIKRGIC